MVSLYKKRYGTSMAIKNILDHNMIFDLNDEGISRKLFFRNIHEPLSTLQYQKEIKFGMNILEIGSNIGYYALIGAKLIGKTGKIYAFEPNPQNYDMLKFNIVLNKYNDLFETYPYGVGAKNGEFVFYMMNKGNTSSFIKRNDSTINIKDERKVKVVCLDDFFDESIKIDYFRMDVEGYEFEIIKGMAKILERNNKPKGAFIEVHSLLLNQMNSSAYDFSEKMKEHGYRIKLARYRGLENFTVFSNKEFKDHDFREIGYWEVFFEKE